MKSLQTAHPWPLRLLRYESVESRSARTRRENELHEAFADLRLSGEWFRFNSAFEATLPLPPSPPPYPPHARIVEKMKNCGKPDCYTCPRGPYLYAQWEEGEKTLDKYIGKKPG